MKNFLASLLSGAVLLLAGCYTQFGTLENQYPSRAAYEASQAVDSTVADSTAPASQTAARTQSQVSQPQHEVCYWTRDWFGEPQLHCYTSYFAGDWDYYYNYPWWYDQSDFIGYNCHCPYHLFYHSDCHLCWQYCGYSRDYGRGNDYGYRNSYYPSHRGSSSGELTPRADTVAHVRRAPYGSLPQPSQILSSGRPAPSSVSTTSGAAKPAVGAAESAAPAVNPAETRMRRSPTPQINPAPVQQSAPPQEVPLQKSAPQETPAATPAASPPPEKKTDDQTTDEPAPVPERQHRSPRSR
jgi:hypothetical protein